MLGVYLRALTEVYRRFYDMPDLRELIKTYVSIQWQSITSNNRNGNKYGVVWLGMGCTTTEDRSVTDCLPRSIHRSQVGTGKRPRHTGGWPRNELGPLTRTLRPFRQAYSILFIILPASCDLLSGGKSRPDFESSPPPLQLERNRNHELASEAVRGNRSSMS